MAKDVPDEHAPRVPPVLDALLRANLRWVRGWLGARLRGVHAQDVDDLAQEVMLRAVRGFASLRDRARFPAWLYRIASNVLRDYLRETAHRTHEVPASALEIEAPRDGQLDASEREELEGALQAVLELPPRYREPVLLRHVDELSYDEIARILGISANAVQVRIFRAREKLRRSAAYRRLFGERRGTSEQLRS